MDNREIIRRLHTIAIASHSGVAESIYDLISDLEQLEDNSTDPTMDMLSNKTTDELHCMYSRLKFQLSQELDKKAAIDAAINKIIHLLKSYADELTSRHDGQTRDQLSVSMVDILPSNSYADELTSRHDGQTREQLSVSMVDILPTKPSDSVKIMNDHYKVSISASI